MISLMLGQLYTMCLLGSKLIVDTASLDIVVKM
jgi:hypothetical protein